MLLFNAQKWALTRARGKGRFIRRFVLRCGLSCAVSISIVGAWADYRLYRLGIFTAPQAVNTFAVATVGLFALSAIVFWGSAELTWWINERLYGRR